MNASLHYPVTIPGVWQGSDHGCNRIDIADGPFTPAASGFAFERFRIGKTKSLTFYLLRLENKNVNL
jgi:hypothetical protein